MGLSEYNKKREFSKTPEPKGGKSAGRELRFVIQKHDATNLHYDFRLEMGGVLKSWAVPKGPSTNPATKRLAMMVEDHPYDYRNFEGTIPKGEYGGGTVMLWDEGTYELAESERLDVNKDLDIKTQEKELLKQLKEGSLKVTLHGQKLKGEYALVKTKGMGENSWLLIKHKDKFASEKDILTKDKSVVSKRSLEQIAKAEGQDETAENKSTKASAKKKANPTTKNKESSGTVSKTLKGAPEQRFYTKVKPMLATLVDEPVDSDEWLYEIKWDGYRAVSFIKGDRVEIKSRNDKSFTDKYPPIVDALKNQNIDAVVDGEIVVIDEKGMAKFGSLQNWKDEEDGELLYYIFDILWYNGHDLKALELTDRKKILKGVFVEDDIIKISKDFLVDGTEFLAAAEKMGLEGIMAKRKDSTYETGRRSPNWLKIKVNKRQEVIICGYTKNEDTSKPFSALLAGVHENGKLVYKGKIGTGFSIQTQKDMLKEFGPLEVKTAPFNDMPDVNKPTRYRGPVKAAITWLKPKLICEVSFTEFTDEGLMRHPSFKGMREDKNAKDVVMEKEKKVEEVVEDATDNKGSETTKKTGTKTANKKGAKKGAKEIKSELKVNGQLLTFTNLDKVYWPKEKITKGQLITYYEQVSPFILPYLKNRPQSLNRFPNGINGENFYQKDVTDKVPDWIDKYQYHTDDSDEDKHFMVGNNKATLLYMANLGCIEINPWSSTTKKPDYPTWCILDLDPDKGNSFDEVIEAAQVIKQILDDMKVPGYCKTSGSTGLHIYIPLGAKYTYEQSKEFARIIVTLATRELPKTTSIERALKDRKGKIYLDFLQNRSQATIAAPYSARPKPGATVSMPLEWDEVKEGLKMQDFTIFNALDRIQNKGDIFKPVLEKGIDIKKVITDYKSMT